MTHYDYFSLTIANSDIRCLKVKYLNILNFDRKLQKFIFRI